MIPDAQTILKRTLSRLEAQSAKIDREIRAVKTALRELGVTAPSLANRRKRRPMGASERRSVSKRMKAYWAKKKAATRT
jgi:hypothetical protein